MNPRQIGKSLSNACLVVAHPDDEILWFSSIISQLAGVIVGFLGQPGRPKVALGRQSVLANYPLDHVSSLELEVADVYDRARWPSPDPAPEGLALDGNRDGEVRARYLANHGRLVEALRHRLAGFNVVFTHNPWGEYGHEEHVQVYRAVRRAQAELGFELWTSAYVGTRSHELMTRCLDGADIESMTLETDVILARDVAERYKENGVWTWFDDYRWPERETFLRITPGRCATPAVVPLTYLNMDRPRVALLDRSLRDLARKIGRAWCRRPASAPYL
jgi:LmbE family N-acetylglucosaminyl deacetylase